MPYIHEFDKHGYRRLPCRQPQPRGWRCTRFGPHRNQPCALVPALWLKFWYRLTGRGDWL